MMSSTRGGYFGFVIILTLISMARSQCRGDLLRARCTSVDVNSKL